MGLQAAVHITTVAKRCGWLSLPARHEGGESRPVLRSSSAKEEERGFLKTNAPPLPGPLLHPGWRRGSFWPQPRVCRQQQYAPGTIKLYESSGTAGGARMTKLEQSVRASWNSALRS